MGINAAFEKGEFDEIIKTPLKVSKINHRATIEVTKDGTEGTAAQALEFVATSDFDIVLEDVVIDRPFIFYLHDTTQKAILFAGKYSNPNA